VLLGHRALYNKAAAQWAVFRPVRLLGLATHYNFVLVLFMFMLTSGSRGQVERRVRACVRALPHPTPHGIRGTHTAFLPLLSPQTTAFFTSVLSISGFVREPRCSNSVTWNPQLRRGAHHNWVGKSGYSPMFRFLCRVSTGDYPEIFGPGWHLFSPGRECIREDVVLILAMACPLEIAVLRMLISGGAAALNAT
jgi:hypothetical protein